MVRKTASKGGVEKITSSLILLLATNALMRFMAD
jgi:hypothetical protein